MSTKVETIQTSDSAKDGKEDAGQKRSSLVVVDESGQSIGIITERDITRGVVPMIS